MTRQTATFGAGCFWSVQDAFERIEGVVGTEAGFAGGSDPGASLETIRAGGTGDAEVVRVAFDTSRIDYETLLGHFFEMHDAGAESAPITRSIVLCHDDAQFALATAACERRAANGPVRTEVATAGAFHPAEAAQQHYFAKQRAAEALAG